MKTHLRMPKERCAISTLLLALTALSAHAQSYSIDWYKVSGGGGASTRGVYSVTGTIGQPDAGGAMTGGNYSLTGGFWSLIAVVQTAGSPTLTVSHSGSSVIRLVAGHGQFHLAAEQQPHCNGQLDNERLLHQHQQWDEQHHHHGAHAQFVLPPGQSLTF